MIASSRAASYLDVDFGVLNSAAFEECVRERRKLCGGQRKFKLDSGSAILQARDAQLMRRGDDDKRERLHIRRHQIHTLDPQARLSPNENLKFRR